LDGALPGLAVDTEMRWVLVKALGNRGVFGNNEIDAELARITLQMAHVTQPKLAL
jgi:hypothetical protein